MPIFNADLDEAFKISEDVATDSEKNDSNPCELGLRYPLLQSIMAGRRTHQTLYDIVYDIIYSIVYDVSYTVSYTIYTYDIVYSISHTIDPDFLLLAGC